MFCLEFVSVQVMRWITMIRSCKRGSLSDWLAAMIGPSATVRLLNLLVSDQYSVKKALGLSNEASTVNVY